MDIDVFSPRDLDTTFRVLRTALNPAGELEQREWRFLATYARIVGRVPGGAQLRPIRSSEVELEGGAHERKRLLQLSAIAALLSVPVRPASVAFVRELSQALGTFDPVIDVLEALHAGRRFKVRLLTMRRMLRAMLKEAYAAEGAAGVLRFLGALFLWATVNKNKARDYKRLGLLPDGTLGREYWKHMTEVGFGFPGEPNGIPDSVAYHDVAHVLASHDTTPFGEIQQGSFQGGNRREDGFFFIQFAILQFHQGIKLAPRAPAQHGYFDPEKVLWAIHRGAKCRVDLTRQWNFWPLMTLPLEEARARLGLLPKLA